MMSNRQTAKERSGHPCEKPQQHTVHAALDGLKTWTPSVPHATMNEHQVHSVQLKQLGKQM
jgi:hypothetical protein